MFTENELGLTPDGTKLLYTVEALPPGASKGNSEEIHIEVVDTKTGKPRFQPIQSVCTAKFSVSAFQAYS